MKHRGITMPEKNHRKIAGALFTATMAVTTSLTGVAMADTAAGSADTRQVSYQGYTFDVPTSWSVVDLTRDPRTCVRFDQHVVYLGDPGAEQDCPSKILGKTEALLLRPSDASGPARTTENPTAAEFTADAPRIKVSATYDTDRSTVRTILARAGLPEATRAANAKAPAVATAPDTFAAAASPNTTVYTGKGFDACSAPSSGTMNAWRNNSPYRSVGIYIGGSKRACAQPNLTASWVNEQAAAGWHFMPLYVGVQASAITSPQNQGTAAAADAINQANALGIGPGSLLYYDMEGDSGYAANRTRALQFLSAWTAELHARGYKSAVYSSSDAAIKDLVDNRNAGYALPDVLFSAVWNNVANTVDPNVPAGLWADHQRVHQYFGNVTESYGGVSVNIDRDYLDVAVGTGPTTPPDGSVLSWYLADSAGVSEATRPMFKYGNTPMVPLSGDFDGSGSDEAATYDPRTST
ncbi:glycoside hydrolase domain-containing protein, partial [Streptomyces sp. SID3343]|uniref:glycoside hydrolase domain-containing protein n=1 Tax=Streptomyces sp. SID3343 TaxID=2690260 RepID=UPI00136D1CB3